jgi:hypothetical protein
VTGTVDVSAEAPVINTTRTGLLHQHSTKRRSTNFRSTAPLVQLRLLTPGAVPDGNVSADQLPRNLGLLNNNTIDGGDNNQAFFAESVAAPRISYSNQPGLPFASFR